VPREDADEFRAADAEPCALCDDRKPAFQVIVWAPTVLHPQPRHFFAGLRKRVASLFKSGTHELSVPASRPC
jgi:hypothetical protein